MIELETKYIQGIITSGYKYLPFSKYFFLQINDLGKFKAWLNQLIPDITTSDRTHFISLPDINTATAVNLAFTYAGLEKLGLPPEALETFPSEFAEGMAEPYRSRRLGDLGNSAPEQWEKPWRRTTRKDGQSETAEQRIDLLLIVQAHDRDYLDQCCEQYLQSFIYSDQPNLDTIGRIVDVQSGYLYKQTCAVKDADRQIREHFGFRDSISQPQINGICKKKADPSAEDLKVGNPDVNVIAAGEFILGYPNELSTSTKTHLPHTPMVPKALDRSPHLKVLSANFSDFGRNGSYLVFRKLQQHVKEFQTYFNQFGEKQKLMEAKVVGRWHSGVPLALAPESDPVSEDNPESIQKWEGQLDNFTYAKPDPYGYGCPIGSHIRRANPRDSLRGDSPEEAIESVKRHRILRRGALYDDGTEQGLLFICINADIRQQFEFIQQNWLQSPNFNGMHGEIDPLIGKNSDDTPRDMTIQQQPIRQKLRGLPNFVTVRAGGYFFLPSICALHFLVDL